jgi:hypothetical protein
VDGMLAGWYIDKDGKVIGKDNNNDDTFYLVRNEKDIGLIETNYRKRLGTDQSKLKGSFFELPTYEERLKFKDVYEKGKNDQSREYGMISTYTYKNDRSDPELNYGYIYNKPGPEFELSSDGKVKGSVKWTTAESLVNNPILDKKMLRFNAHTHNYNTEDTFGEFKPRLKPPSDTDNEVIREYFIGGVVFDTENEIVWIYDGKQKFSGRMNSTIFFNKFENEK